MWRRNVHTAQTRSAPTQQRVRRSVSWAAKSLVPSTSNVTEIVRTLPLLLRSVPMGHQFLLQSSSRVRGFRSSGSRIILQMPHEYLCEANGENPLTCDIDLDIQRKDGPTVKLALRGSKSLISTLQKKRMAVTVCCSSMATTLTIRVAFLNMLA